MGAIILVSLVNPPRRPRKKDAAKEADSEPQKPPIETGVWHLLYTRSLCSYCSVHAIAVRAP